MMSWLSYFLFGVAIVLIAIKLIVKLTTGWCRSNVCLVGKTVIVTGCNSGIGYESAEDFAKRGARVILACRNEGRGNDAVQRIIRATDNQNVVFKPLDLSSLKSVRHFAQHVNQTEARLDILLNNAGALCLGPEKSEDGFLMTMATNYFGPFLLTNLLLDLIKKTPNSRIVNVSSITANSNRKELLDINKLNHFPADAGSPDWLVYSRSKLCNILFTIELAARLKGTGVTTYSLHPGTILTDIFNNTSQYLQIFLKCIAFIFKDNLEGAQTSIHCSVAKGLESLSGEHFVDCDSVSRYKTAKDPDLPKQLWKISEELVKLN